MLPTFSECTIAGWYSPWSLEIHLKTKKIRDREKALAAKKAQRTKVLSPTPFCVIICSRIFTKWLSFHRRLGCFALSSSSIRLCVLGPCNLNSPFWGSLALCWSSTTLYFISYSAREPWDVYAKTGKLNCYYAGNYSCSLSRWICGGGDLQINGDYCRYHGASSKFNYSTGFGILPMYISETCTSLLFAVQFQYTYLTAQLRSIFVVWADTTPPKRPFKNLQQNMVDANLCPGANVYFSFTPSPGKWASHISISIFKPQHRQMFL